MNHSHEYLEADWNYQHIWDTGMEAPQDSLTSVGRDFADAFATERSHIHDLERRQSHEHFAARRQQVEQWRDFYVAKQRYEDAEQLAASLFTPEEDILHLNIGGQGSLTVSRRTLLKHQDSALAAMFSGRHALVTYKGAFFIDRNFEPFANVVSFLRSGRKPKSAEAEREFREEMDYWGIPLDELEKKEAKPPVRLFDVRLSSQTLIFESDMQTARKSGTDHAMLFTAVKMDLQVTYVQFSVTVHSPSEDSCELQLGLVDPATLPPRLAASYLWTQAPNSYFWDACDNKLIRTDSRRNPTECEDYSCYCSGEKSTFGLLFDPRLHTVAFYKDGISQGVAFNCVECGLTPVLDLWFESGEVTIQQTTKPG